jgi:cAMP-dependent protein kinase regulator
MEQTASLRDMSPEEYLTAKNVKQFLTRIVVSLLELRPDNIERHVINLLNVSQPKAAPSEPFPAFPTKAPEAFPAFQGGKPAVPPDASTANSRLGALPGTPTATGRRQSAISPDVLRRAAAGGRRQVILGRPAPSNAPVQVIPKDPETFAALEATVKKVDLFSFLQEDQRKMLVDAMFKKEYGDGAKIIQEGDQPDNFYILQSGRTRVLKKKAGVDEQVACLGPGAYFGELALISGSTRAASIIADGACVCWAIDQATYLGLLKEHHGRKRQRYRTLLRNVPFLKALQDYEILLVADALRPVNPDDGHVMMRQGDVGEDFFIILDGECIVLKKFPDEDTEREVARLQPGAYFGEMALLTNMPRAATVVAGRNCKLISLDGKSFHRLLGPCSAVFQENMKKY